jgi:hypothetical protein
MTDAITEKKELAPAGNRAEVVSVDTGEFSAIMDTAKFNHLWRVALLFSKSDLVPAHYKGKPENCMISIQMALRLQVDPMMLLQNTYIVQGKPGMEAKLAIALINSSGLFAEPLQYEIKGVKGKDLECRAWTVNKAGKHIEGPWVTWEMAKAEGWIDKSGSKWKTMPELMIQYRAATFFGRLVCPERLMGMLTVEELQDMDNKRDTGAELERRMKLVPAEPVPEQLAEPLQPAEDAKMPEQPTSEGLTGIKLDLYTKVADMAAGDMLEMNKILSNLSGKKIACKDDLIAADETLAKELLSKMSGGK